MPSLDSSRSGQVWDESGRFGWPWGSSGHRGAGWEWRMEGTEASWNRTAGGCSEAKRGALGVLLVIVHLGPGMMGREEAPAAELAVGWGTGEGLRTAFRLRQETP